MKATLAAIFSVVIALSWFSLAAQETAPGQEPPEEQTQDRPAPVALTAPAEAEQIARTEKLQALQLQVDNCNMTFMGKPIEHKKCIQKIVESMNGESAPEATVNAKSDRE